MLHPFRLRPALLTAVLVLLTACAGTGSGNGAQVARQDIDSDEAQVYLRRAAQESGGDLDRTTLLIRAGRRALDDGNSAAADELIAELQSIRETSRLDEEQIWRARLLAAELALMTGPPSAALRELGSLPPPDAARSLSPDLYQQLLSQRAEIYLANEQYLAAARDRISLRPLLDDDERITNNNRIWQILSSAPPGSYTGQEAIVDSYELRGWLELRDVAQTYQDNIEDQIRAIEQWRERWNRHSAADRLPDSLAYLVELWETRPSRIALLLPLQQAAGNAVNQGFMAAYFHALGQGQEVPEIRVYDTSDTGRIPAVYEQAVEDGAELVIGPLDKNAVRALQARRMLPVTTLALNYGDEGRLNPEGLYQFGLAPEDEIDQTALLAWRANHRLAAVLTPAGEQYARIPAAFSERWRALGGSVVSSATFPADSGYSDTIRQLLAIDASEARAERLTDVLPRQEVEFIPRRRQDIDFLFLLASPEQGRQIAPTLDFHYAGDVPVYAMPSIYDGGSERNRNRDLDGVIFTDAPWLLQDDYPMKQELQAVWPVASGPVRRLRAMGADSYRLHSRLAQLINYPDTRMQGATGTLSLQGDGRIQRELLGARFVNGEPRLLPAAITVTDTGLAGGN